MVNAKEVVQRDYHYLGMGKVVNSPVRAVAPLASSLVKVGHVVSSPKSHLGVPVKQKPTSCTSTLDNSADATSSESQQSYSDDGVMNYAL